MNEVGIIGSFLTAFGIICILIGAKVDAITYGTHFKKSTSLGFLIGGIAGTVVGLIAFFWGVVEEMWTNEKENQKSKQKLLEQQEELHEENTRF